MQSSTSMFSAGCVCVGGGGALSFPWIFALPLEKYARNIMYARHLMPPPTLQHYDLSPLETLAFLYTYQNTSPSFSNNFLVMRAFSRFLVTNKNSLESLVCYWVHISLWLYSLLKEDRIFRSFIDAHHLKLVWSCILFSPLIVITHVGHVLVAWLVLDLLFNACPLLGTCLLTT